MASLAELALGARATIHHVGGERAFRRRLMELGFLPGTEATLRRAAPLGDPLEFEVRHCSISIRRREAAAIETMSPPAIERRR